MIRLLHTADWQIGITRHFLGDEAQSRYSEARLDAVRQMARRAAETRCDAVLVGGDVFESNLVDRQVVARTLDALAEFTVPVLLLPGNHDPLLGAGSVWESATFTARCPSNVTVLRDATPVSIADGRAEVVGAVWPSKRPIGDLVAAALDGLPVPRVPRIVLGHGAVDRLSPDPDDPALIGLEQLERAIVAGEVAYVALGDRHSATPVGTTGRIWYSGTPLVTDYSEDAPNRALIVEIDSDRVAVAPEPVGDWAFTRADFALTRDDDLAAVADWLEAQPDKRRCVAKLSFTGTVSLAGRLRLDALLDTYTDVFAALETWERRTDLVVVPDEADLSDIGASGFLAAAVTDLHALASGDGPDAPAAQDALSLLYRLSRDVS
jgi:DNA repair exonuclease SbcCD nuclease subunit